MKLEDLQTFFPVLGIPDLSLFKAKNPEMSNFSNFLTQLCDVICLGIIQEIIKSRSFELKNWPTEQVPLTHLFTKSIQIHFIVCWSNEQKR